MPTVDELIYWATIRDNHLNHDEVMARWDALDELMKDDPDA